MLAAVPALACELKEVLTLPRRYRLTRREGFSRILQRKAQIKSWFAVYSEKNTAGHARIGISVSKRVLNTATQRNFTKRLIRECFRKCSKQGVARDIVVRLRNSLSSKDCVEARSVLTEMLKTALAAR